MHADVFVNFSKMLLSKLRKYGHFRCIEFNFAFPKVQSRKCVDIPNFLEIVKA